MSKKHHLHRVMRRSALSLALGLCFASGAFAQSNTAGSINGSAGAGETVTITNEATGFSREVTVGSDGSFRVSSLPVGTYKVSSGGEVREVSVSVGTGANVNFLADATTLAAMRVTGTGVSPIDMTSVESTTILTEALLDEIPVARNVTAVTLLAPGTTQGDAAFGNLASFGGASVGENAYYINGFNVTNFRNGLGGSTVPFEFYQEFQVKTGGYGAEFGRSTGGVVNTVTKRGTNEFKAGVNTYYVPGGSAENSPCTYVPDGAGGFTQVGYSCLTERGDQYEANVHASGAIIKDRLFFYGIYNVRDYGFQYFDGNANQTRDNTDPFWGVKLDWAITDNHFLEYTGFSDETSIVDIDQVSGGGATFDRGGRNDIFKYTGYLTDNFTVSALWGKGEYNLTDRGDGDACPFVYDGRSGSLIPLGCWTNSLPSQASDSREAKRLDMEWVLNNHRLRFGLDREENNSQDLSQYSGGAYYRYYAAGALPERVRVRYYFNGGSFDVNSEAFYLEDNWQVSDNVLLSLGVRNEQFENKNGLGETFIEIKDQWAPRLGLSWDIDGDGSKKFFSSYGRYHLPVASNTNVRLAGGETFTEQYFTFSAIDPTTGAPTLGTALGPVTVFGDGSISDPRQIVDQNIKPMYQDEFILGYQMELGGGWTGGVRAIHRDLKSTIEDVAIDAALNAYAAANGFPGFSAGGFDYYVLTNPGNDMEVWVDLDGDSVLEQVNLTAAQLGYPASERYYNAMEFFFEKSFNDKWFLQGSYTLAHSYGNNEGYVRSDNGQDDAGLTTLFDQPGLVDGAYGDLPNDVRHQIKVFGAYKFNEEWTVSANFLWKSGRPINCFGNHPTDVFAEAYGSASFYCGGNLVPRASLGRTPNRHQLDLGVEYRPEALDGRFAVKADVVNVFNLDTVTEVSEIGEDDHDPASFPLPRFLTPTAYQQPRYVRIALSYEW